MDLRTVVLCLILTTILLAENFVTGQVCNEELYDQNKILDFPENGENYTNNLNCTWTFIAPTWRVVEITFMKIDLQPMYQDVCKDVMTVFDGVLGSQPFTPPFCDDGPSWPRKPHRFLSTSNKLTITMVTDGNATGTGFVAHYKHVPSRKESIAVINIEDPSIRQFNRFSTLLFDRIPLLQSTHPSALDFDPITEFFYYTDIDAGFIGRIKNDASSDEILVEKNVQTPLGIAVGYLTGLLYWTDVGRHEVGVSRLDGTFRTTLGFLNTSCYSPKAITLSSDQQSVFWTCSQKIVKAKADGSEIQTLVDGLRDPATLILDAGMFLYWVDKGTSSVSRIQTDGTMKEQLFKSDIFSNVHSFVLDSFAYYWSLTGYKIIIDVDRDNPVRYESLSTERAVSLGGLYYYKSDTTIAQQHPCATDGAGCEELCFPEGLGGRCVEVSPNVVNCPNEIRMTTSGSYQPVSWEEPAALSHTSQQDGQLLTDVTRNILPGALFFLGNTTVTYTFKDEFSNTAICSFNVILLPTTTTIPTTDVATSKTTKSTTSATTSSSKSRDFSLDSFSTKYLVYILGVIIAVLCVIIVTVVCITCWCGCWKSSCRAKDQRPSNSAPPTYMDTTQYDKRIAYNMGPVGSGMGHAHFNSRPAY